MDTFEYIGKTLEVPMPSNFSITIREQNGEDDEVISRVGDATDGNSINIFLTRIIIANSLLNGGKTSLADILSWRLRDKYYLLLKSRIHSMGPNLDFDFICTNVKCAKLSHYTEDLSLYDWDLSKPTPKLGELNYFAHRIQPFEHINSKERELSLK